MKTLRKKYITPSLEEIIVDCRNTVMLIGSGGDGIPGDNAESNQRDFYEPFDFSDAIQEWNDEIFVR